MILTIDKNRANAICAISIMNENSQRTMNLDKFSSRRPQRPEPREIIESNWHPITARTIWRGGAEGESTPRGLHIWIWEAVSRSTALHIKRYDVITQWHCGQTATYISFILQRINANRRAIIQAPSWGLPIQIQKTWPLTSVLPGQILPAGTKSIKSIKLSTQCV